MSSENSQPEAKRIAALFADLGVVLVHFIGESTGVGSAVTDDLSPIEAAQRVVDTKCEVSCSTVSKGDNRARNNYFGSIGLILDPIDRSNITHCGSADGGTKGPESGSTVRTGTNGLNSEEDIKSAVIGRATQAHNEICAKGYRVIGIFHEGAKPVTLQFSRKNGTREFSYSYLDFVKSLGELPLYAWNGSQFMRLEFHSSANGIGISNAIPVEISNVYT